MKPLIAPALLALATLTASASAQPLADPMRPPQGASVAGASAVVAQPVVQTIIIGPTHRYAVIDGRTVTQGERIGDARVLRITENEVTLRGANGKPVVIGLLPQVQKKPSSTKDRGGIALQEKNP